jgi:CHAT domain-containing protein
MERTAIATEIRNLEMDLGKKQELLSKEISFQGNTIPPIKDLQSSVLDNETAIISYTLSGEKLTTTVIMKDSSFPLQRNLPAGFHEELKTFIGSLVAAKSSFSKAVSNELYSNLLGQLRLEKIKHLVIIPDNELCYLPFESLVDAKGNWIIGKYSLQYQYCTSVLKKDPVNFRGHQSLSFAPFSSSGLGGFERLPNSLSEIENLKGEKLTDTSANKANLLKHIADYEVLHLATHAVVNSSQEDFSYIMFAGADSDQQRLYAGEIYNLPLRRTDLVILSACETGSGALVKGEGVMSLSRAFTYAGCSNVITSLWKADDYSTAWLTNKVHSYLNKGLSIDRALQQAKLDYLHDPKINPRLKEPYYWAHLVFIGNITESHSFPVLLVIAIGIIVLLTVFLLIKRFPTRRNRAS